MQIQDFLQERLEESKKTMAPFLDLGNCGLTELPKELAGFTWLEDINLGTVFWSDTDQKFFESRNSGPLNNLEREDFGALKGLSGLRRLSLRNCSVRNLSSIRNLSQLRALTLGGNELDDIRPLGQMLDLEVLSLYDNNIDSIEHIQGLTKLQVLSFNYNKVEDLSALANMPDLRELHAAGNVIGDISPLTANTRLEKINLNNNKIRFIRPLTALPLLRALSIDRNPIEDCPPEIALSGDVERIRGYFSTMFRSEKEALPLHQGAEPPGKSLAMPPGPALEVKLILVGNATAGKTSLSRILRGEAFNQKENSTHGIQIHEWIISPEEINAAMPGHEVKEGLRVNIWDFGGQEYYHGTHQIFLDNNAAYLLVWDHLHNANLIESTPVFIDGQQQEVEQEHFHFRYWLDSIRFHASGDSGNDKPPLVLVQNKIDLTEPGRPDVLDSGILREYEAEYAYGVSAMLARSKKAADRRYRHGFDIFRDDLIRMLYRKAAQTHRDNIPVVWTQIRNMMRALRSTRKKNSANPYASLLKDKAWLHFKDFTKASRTLNPDLTDQEMETLAWYLHQIGTVVWLPHIDGKVYTDPSWLTSKIYNVLNKEVLQREGRFSTTDVRSAIGDDNETQLLLNLMREWEIIFSADTPQSKWVAPQYLPMEHPMENLFNIALSGLQDQFYMIKTPLFHYRKMLRRLIFQYGNDPTVGKKEFWKQGILFVTQDSQLRVFIKGLQESQEADEGRLMICVERGKPDSESWQQRILSDALTIFLDKRRTIGIGDNSGWLNLANNLRDQVENQRKFQISLDGRAFVSLAELVQAARSGLSSLVNGQGTRFRLQDFSPVLTTLQITPSLPTIFFSYAHDDKTLRDQLDMHLTPLRRTGKAKTWHDGAIGAGENWEETIRKNLKSADVILLLISPSFINSEFIWQSELQVALERHQRRECQVIPVLLRPCAWEGLPFDRLQMLPHSTDTARLRAVTLWQDPDEAFTLIARAIRQALQELNIQ